MLRVVNDASHGTENTRERWADNTGYCEKQKNVTAKNEKSLHGEDSLPEMICCAAEPAGWMEKKRLAAEDGRYKKCRSN
jgi:hypothetical protein